MHKADASLQISSHQELKKHPKTLRVHLRHLPFVLRTFAIVLVIIAIARPQLSDRWQTEDTEGIDIVIAFDLSTSMSLHDITPSRKEVARQMSIEFIRNRPNDNIGLVVFAGEAFTQVPLTTDHAVLINMLNALEFGMIEDGTAIGLGLATAVARVMEGPAESKVVILLTDGDNNAGDIMPITAGEIAQAMGVRVYTIGVGTENPIRIPVFRDAFGRVRYEYIVDTFDEAPLIEIARMTGGIYGRATDVNSLREIYRRIDELETSLISVSEFSERIEFFHIFALLAFILLALEIILRNTYLKSKP
jgi:Ca-activated chloride channel family protein